jgi:hypothetical protein
MKVLNENWQKINCEPIEITLRDEIGISSEKSDVVNMGEIVKDTFSRYGEYEKKTEKALYKAVYNVGSSNAVGAKYILDRLVKIQNARKG